MNGVPEQIVLAELIQKELDGGLTDQEFDVLQSMLKKDAAAVNYYVKTIFAISAFSATSITPALESIEEDQDSLMDTLVLLAKDAQTAPAIEIPKEQTQQELIQKVVHPPRQKRKVSKFNLFTLAASAAAMLLLVLFLKFAPERRNSIEVATLVDQMNVQWSGPGVDLENGSRLWTNDYSLNLKKGLLSIAYDQGVEVVIEGPAMFEIKQSGIFLEYGRLYSQVSETGTGFTVSTSTSQFVDMGTEFGVQADIDGSSELHVTKGKVQLFAGASGETKVTQMVSENQAVRYNAIRGRIKEIRVKGNTFVRKISSAFNHTWTAPNAYEQAVLETEPLHYWRFDGDHEGVLLDEINPSLDNEYKLFGSLGYSNGPAFGGGTSTALRLTGRQEDYAILCEVTDEADDAEGFSIAMWIRPEKADSAFKKNIIMRFKAVGIEGVGGRRSLGFDEKNRFYFHVLSNSDAMQEEDWERISIRSNPVVVDTWHHVVIAYTKNERVNLYVDGELQATQEILSSLEPANKNSQWCLGSAAVASEYSESHTSFVGSLDEISHYDRELSSEEVEMLQAAAGQK